VITLLHTADWHIGATLQGWPREGEHRAALAQIVEIAAAREVDAIIVAGDIFDSLNPSAEAQRLLYDTLRDLRAARKSASIHLIAGNHDPAGRLEAVRALFDFVDIHCVGTIARKDGVFDLDAHLRPLRDATGAVQAYLLAVPFPRAADLPLAPRDVEGSPVAYAVRALYAEMIAAARARIGPAPLVVTGHLHVAGGLESEGAERRILIGGEHAIPPDLFPPDLAYAALGHLHRPQSVGRATIRYAGSLLPMSKTEIDYTHGVSIVTLDDAGAATIEHTPITRSVAALRVPERGALAPTAVETAFKALALDADAPIDRQPFVHLQVEVDGPAVGLKAEMDALAEKFPLRLVSLAVRSADVAQQIANAPEAQRLSERRPEDLFRDAYLRAHGAAPTDAHMRLFASVAEEA
jgi:DNA repair protein SbcD/Mre11